MSLGKRAVCSQQRTQLVLFGCFGSDVTKQLAATSQHTIFSMPTPKKYWKGKLVGSILLAVDRSKQHLNISSVLLKIIGGWTVDLLLSKFSVYVRACVGFFEFSNGIFYSPIQNGIYFQISFLFVFFCLKHPMCSVFF